MKQLIFIVTAALLAAGTCNRTNAQNMDGTKKISAFSVGDKLPETFLKYFIGQAYLARLTQNGRLNSPISSVTFDPGCRNNRRSHTGSQILVAVGGRGYYQASAVKNRADLFSGGESELAATDPELIENFDNFALPEVPDYGNLDAKTRMMCVLASCIAGAAQTEFRTILEGALNVGVTSVEAKESVYRAVPYVGYPRTLNAIACLNEVVPENE